MCEWDLREVAEGVTDLIHVHTAQERCWGWLGFISENSFLLQRSQAVGFVTGSLSPSFGHNSSLSIKKNALLRQSGLFWKGFSLLSQAGSLHQYMTKMEAALPH